MKPGVSGSPVPCRCTFCEGKGGDAEMFALVFKGSDPPASLFSMGQLSVCLPHPLQAPTAHCLGFSSCRVGDRKEHSPPPLPFACHTQPSEPIPMGLPGFLVCLVWFCTVPLAWNSLLKVWLCVSCDPCLIHHCPVPPTGFVWLVITLL